MKNIPFLDLKICGKEKQELLNSISEVFGHGKLVLGPEVIEFEKRISAFCNRKFAISVNSGSDALFLALKALGITKGDEVITTSLSWIATANAIAMTGATPIFADIDDDLNVDPESIRKLISSRTKAILPVHYTGRICDMEKITKIAKENNLFVIEDGSQAFGAKKYGRIAGSFGDFGCFSLNPMKILGACGEAGVIVCDNPNFYNKILALRYNGTINKEICVEFGLNSRMDTIQAAILLKKLSSLNQNIKKRREFAKIYNNRLQDFVHIPHEKPDEFNIYYAYMIRAARRDELKNFLLARGIETKIQHPFLMYQQPAYSKQFNTNPLKNSEKIVKEILSIPCHEKLSKDDVHYISDQICNFYKN